MSAAELGRQFLHSCFPRDELTREMRQLELRHLVNRPDSEISGCILQELRCKHAHSVDREFPNEDGPKRRKCQLLIALQRSSLTNGASQKHNQDGIQLGPSA